VRQSAIPKAKAKSIRFLTEVRRSDSSSWHSGVSFSFLLLIPFLHLLRYYYLVRLIGMVQNPLLDPTVPSYFIGVSSN